MTRWALARLAGACFFPPGGHFLPCHPSENPKLSPLSYESIAKRSLVESVLSSRRRVTTVATGGFVFRCGLWPSTSFYPCRPKGRAPDPLCVRDAELKTFAESNQSLCRSSTTTTRRCTTVAFTNPVMIAVGRFTSSSSFSVSLKCWSANAPGLLHVNSGV